MDNHILSVKGLSHGYGNLKILDQLDFSLDRNKIIALSAPSGAGKSTLLHILGLLERPQKGEVFINGISGWSINDAKRTKLRRLDCGFVFQFHYLMPEFNARENIMMPLRLNGINRKEAMQKANELLEKIGLNHRGHHLPAELSGGEQQRVAIARALANRPKIILADEPTGNLDPATGASVFELFLDLVKDNQASCLIVTHDPSLAQKCDQRLTLDQGKIHNNGY